MTDDRDIVRGYSQDRHIYHHNSISTKRKTSTQINRTSANYYSNRNCPEILSLFALQNKHLENQEKQIYQSVANDTHYFNMINYPIQSPPPTPFSTLAFLNNNQQEKQPKFPKLTPRITSTAGNKFPTLTPRNTPIVDNQNPMPTIRTSVKSISSSFNKPGQIKMPIVSIEKKNTFQSTHHLHRLE